MSENTEGFGPDRVISLLSLNLNLKQLPVVLLISNCWEIDVQLTPIFPDDSIINASLLSANVVYSSAEFIIWNRISPDLIRILSGPDGADVSFPLNNSNSEKSVVLLLYNLSAITVILLPASPFTPLKHNTLAVLLFPITTLDCKLIKSLLEFTVSAPLLFKVKSVKLVALPVGAPKLNLKQLPVELLISNCLDGNVVPMPVVPSITKLDKRPNSVIPVWEAVAILPLKLVADIELAPDKEPVIVMLVTVVIEPAIANVVNWPNSVTLGWTAAACVNAPVIFVATKDVAVKELILVIFLLASKIKALLAEAVPAVTPVKDPKLDKTVVISLPPIDILVADNVFVVIPPVTFRLDKLPNLVIFVCSGVTIRPFKFTAVKLPPQVMLPVVVKVVTPEIVPAKVKLFKVPTPVIPVWGPEDKVPFKVVAVKVFADKVLIPLILPLEFNTNDLDTWATPGVVTSL